MSENETNDIWDEDLLGRNEDADFLINFLKNRIEERKISHRTGSYVLNIDASYGEGKTFFLKRLHEQLSSNHPTVYINAWQNDHADTPLLALVSEIEKALHPYLSANDKIEKAFNGLKKNGIQVAAAVVKGAGVQLAKHVIGESLETVVGLVTANNNQLTNDENIIKENISKKIDQLIDRNLEKPLKEFQGNCNSIEQFRINLKDLVQSFEENNKLNPPLFILIDELDRCRPNYAISLLEQVKHLFEVDGVVFVIATDSKQLCAAIKAVYGAEFESDRYLRRFFDRTYIFPEPDRKKFVQKLFKTLPLTVKVRGILKEQPEDIFLSAMNAFDMKLRDIEQCYDLLRVIATTWQYKTQIELIYILPLIATFHNNDMEAFSLLMAGKPIEIPKPWSITYQMKNNFESQVGQRTINIKNIIQIVLQNLDTPLHNIKGSSNEDMAVDYIHLIFSDEFQHLHQSQFSYDKPGPFTVLRNYPALVRSAGRLQNSESQKPSELRR